MTQTKKAPVAEQEPKQRPKTRIPIRRWVVIRRDWRTGKSTPVAYFVSPSYAHIFKRALGEMSDTTFQIKEVLR